MKIKVREMIKPVGGFFEIYVSTPIEVCEQRDRKGLCAKARAGLVKEFTGISDPCEVPVPPEITLDTSVGIPEQEAEEVLTRLIESGFIRRLTD